MGAPKGGGGGEDTKEEEVGAAVAAAVVSEGRQVWVRPSVRPVSPIFSCRPTPNL